MGVDEGDTRRRLCTGTEISGGHHRLADATNLL